MHPWCDGGCTVSVETAGCVVSFVVALFSCARYVVLAEGANSVLAERHGLVTRPAGEAMALGIKEVLSLETSAIEERFHLENNEGAALLFSGGICDDLPGGAFL